MATTTWTKSFLGRRGEGLFLEFYYGQLGTSDGARVALIDLGGILTVDIEQPTSQNRRLIFSYDGNEIEYVLDNVDSRVYRVAAFISSGGTFKVRGVDSAIDASPLTSTPTYLSLDDEGAGTLNSALSDILVYDYQARPINRELRRGEAVQKGDLLGDAVFYAKLNFAVGFNSDDGTAAVVDPAFPPIRADGFDPFSGNLSTVDLMDFGAVKLVEPPLTLRFSQRGKSTQLPETLGTIPSLIDASNKPAELQVGGTNENISALGSRDELMAQWEDHPYSDILTDPYRDQRTYDPESQGTFWGKWLARNVYKQGFAMRYVSGYELPGGGLERTHTYNYILEKVNGPTSTGKVTAQGYDILQSLRADRAVFPAANTGRLSADISDTATAFTLEPVGVGDEEYPSSGTFRIRIGGEGFDVTRSGDDFTVVTRGLYGGAESHSAEDVVQEVAQLSDQIHDVAYTIITGALPELAGNIPKAKWDGLADDFLPRIYSADITEPTGVEDLLGELVATAPIYFYADVRTNLIELGVIREPSGVATPLREGQELIADSVNLKEYPKERIDEVWVYYRIRDAAGDIEEEENYSQRFILVNPTEQQRRGRRSIRRIYSRWIEAGARDTAEEIAQAYISRFQNQPIRVSFDLDAKHGDIWLGDVAALVSRQKQTVTGEKREDLNYQVIRAQESSQGHKFTYIAQSYEFFAPIDPDSITITIQPEDNLADDGTVDQIDLRELYDATVATEIPTITFVVAGGPVPSGGTVVGAGTGQTWSLRNPNDWPWGPTIELRIEPGGVVAGRGGTGGDGGSVPSPNGTDGTDGQTGFLCQYATNVNNLGIIGGGGGGAGGGGVVFTGTGNDNNRVFAGGGGGGGAGKTSVGGVRSTRSRNIGNPPRSESENGEPGTPTAGGAGGIGTFGARSGGTPERGGGNGGNGGGLGQAGQPGSDGDGSLIPEGGATEGTGGAGGAPGNAIDGVSFITYITEGDIRGNQV